MSSGWLLNGPFPVDPGRGRLAGSIEDRHERFADLGQALGEQLLSLYDLVENDWKTLADTLDLRITDSDRKARFWCRVFDVISRDPDDEIARGLHAVDRGYGRLVAERPVVPTGLPKPFDCLVPASSVGMFTDKALAGTGILEATQHWENGRPTERPNCILRGSGTVEETRLRPDTTDHAVGAAADRDGRRQAN